MPQDLCATRAGLTATARTRHIAEATLRCKSTSLNQRCATLNTVCARCLTPFWSRPPHPAAKPQCRSLTVAMNAHVRLPSQGGRSFPPKAASASLRPRGRHCCCSQYANTSRPSAVSDCSANSSAACLWPTGLRTADPRHDHRLAPIHAHTARNRSEHLPVSTNGLHRNPAQREPHGVPPWPMRRSATNYTSPVPCAGCEQALS